jgi:hypothetical protein
MPFPEIDYTPQALEEVEEAIGWYGARSFRAAFGFVMELNRGLGRIQESPNQ